MRSAGTVFSLRWQPCRTFSRVIPCKLGAVTTRTLIKNLAAASDGETSVSGWVDTVRDQKKVQFVVLRDESGAVQLVHPRSFDEDGTPAEDPARRDHLRARAGHLPHRHRRAQARRARQARRRRDQARRRSRSPLRPSPRRRSPRTPASTSAWTGASSTCAVPSNNLIFRIQTTLEHALRTYWVENDFIEIHTPKLMASASESKRRAVRGRLLRDARRTSRRARSSSSRWRSPPASARSSRSAPRFRADPSLHQPSRDRVHDASTRDQLDRQPRRRHEAARGAPRRRLPGGQGQARRRDRGALRHRGDGADARRSPASRSPRPSRSSPSAATRCPAPTTTWTRRASARSPPT